MGPRELLDVLERLGLGQGVLKCVVKSQPTESMYRVKYNDDWDTSSASRVDFGFGAIDGPGAVFISRVSTS